MLKGFLSAPLRVVPLALLLASTGATSYGCGRDHNLGVSTSSSSSSGAGGDGGAGTTSSSTSGSTSSSSGSGGDGGADSGPPGPTTLTLVNAVNDYDAVRFCFLPYPAGDPAAVPYPASPAGLAFGKAQIIDPISGPIPSGTDVRTWVIAGDLSQIAGKTCDEAITMAESDPTMSLVATALAVIPAITFDSHKALMLAAAGCLGGPGHDGPTATLGCGQSYTPSNPTATLAALPMSRTRDPSRVNVQVADLSAAMPSSDVSVTPGFEGAMDVRIGGPFTLGAIAPNPPFAGLAAVEYGTIASAYVKTSLPNSMFTTSATPLAQVIANGGLADGDFINGKNFVLVAIGGYPSVQPGPFWHAFTFTMLIVDP